MNRQGKWVIRIWSNFDDPYFEGHLTEKKKTLGDFFFMGHNNCVKFQANRSR